MKRGPRLYLQDILDSIGCIESYTNGLTFDQFAGEQMRVDAVIRNFEIIGEASSHIPAELKELADSVPWDKVRSMRNIMIHEYFGVDSQILWQTIGDSLPELKKAATDMLDAIRD